MIAALDAPVAIISSHLFSFEYDRTRCIKSTCEHGLFETALRPSQDTAGRGGASEGDDGEDATAASGKPRVLPDPQDQRPAATGLQSGHLSLQAGSLFVADHRRAGGKGGDAGRGAGGSHGASTIDHVPPVE